MATMVTCARHNVIAHFVIGAVGVLGSATYDLAVAVFPQSFAAYTPWSRLGHVASYWSSVAFTRTGCRQKICTAYLIVTLKC